MPENCRIAGSFDELCQKVDIMLDSSPGGVGAKNKEKYYDKYGVKAVFQGGEKNSVADVFFHGYANYEKGVGQKYLKLTSCNTTGLIRTVDCLDREIGIEKVAITIIRRVADPGDYHRGLTNALQMDKAPSHQAVDLMTIIPERGVFLRKRTPALFRLLHAAARSRFALFQQPDTVGLLLVLAFQFNRTGADR